VPKELIGDIAKAEDLFSHLNKLAKKELGYLNDMSVIVSIKDSRYVVRL